MQTPKKQFIAIDLKSFYASVEAEERGFDPLDVNLVVADESRTDKTICLAVSPSLKKIGVPGRARLFEARSIVREENRKRLQKAPGRRFSGKSHFPSELSKDPSLELDFVIAPPRMRYYMDYSRKIVEIYLRHISPDDLLVYSIDEVFIDATHYLESPGMTAREFAMMMIREVLRETGITATAGIGTNLYLAKIAMDIVAKHIPADERGVRIAELDEKSYREKLWCHRPITDFWRVGHGIARKLESRGIYTMGDIARVSAGPENSLYSEELLYKLFGVNAELLIDHAWGYEPTEIADCKAFRPSSKSLCQGQVLMRPYSFGEGRIVVQEMAEQLSDDLLEKGLYAGQIVLDAGYDVENLLSPEKAASYTGAVETDRYGRKVPQGVHGSENLGGYTVSAKRLEEAACRLYDRLVDRGLYLRRFQVTAADVLTEEEKRERDEAPAQMTLLGTLSAEKEARETEEKNQKRERRKQEAILGLREKYGKNAVIRGLNMQEGATAVERNAQIGGHRA